MNADDEPLAADADDPAGDDASPPEASNEGDDSLAGRVLALVRTPGYRPAKPSVIAKLLGLNATENRALARLVKRLVKRGELNYGPRHLVEAGTQPPAHPAPPTRAARPRTGQEAGLTGTFIRKAGGFGFVRLKRPSGSEPGDDIFIPAKATGDASTGDTVLVRLTRDGRYGAGNRQGEIVRIVERDTHQFVGTYFETGGSGYVQVDGTLFAAPIFVGDAGAKSARPDDKVVFEMVRFPSPAHDGEGVITEVLGARGQPGVDTLSIVREFELPEVFDEDVLEQCRQQAELFDETNLGDRTDFTAETVITIDPVDARDFDDAISLVEQENGHWLLGVHIADVAHFVPPKTALDREAYARATSVYLPDRVLPMLPELISNSLASLQPDRVRYTKSAIIEFSPEGVPVHVELHRSAIRSQRRFAYEEVDDYLAAPDGWRAKLTPVVHALLERMHRLAMILRRRRFARGALELSMPEVKIDLDREGRVSGAHRVQNTTSHQIIEEFMLAANIAVAEKLHAAGWPFLRRIHPTPDPRKQKLLTDFVNELGFAVDSLESRFELQKLLNRVVGHPAEYAVNYAVLRSLQRAVYSPIEEGHYALASDCYCHFTSPIRRYPDLTIHRLVDALLLGRKVRHDLGELAAQGEHCSEREQRAEAAERELIKLKLLHYLSERIGDELRAVVTGVEDYGLFVQGLELPAEGLIHITSLQDDFYRYDRASHTLTGRRAGNAFRLGDILQVVVARVDLDRRELDFRLAGREASPRTPRPERSPRGDRRGTSRQPGKTPQHRPPNKGRPKRGRR
ncbi:MAG: ribonuclease R [Pirellulales bacterium]|nr:ribonuclease R [Pirellulales bacterium]